MKPFASKETGINWLGEVPEHWLVKSIKWCTRVKRGASPRPIDDQVYFDEHGRYAWVRIEDVTASSMYLKETRQRLSSLGSSLSVKMSPGSLFLSIAGSVGKPCITTIECCIHDGFVYFPDWKGDTRYLFYIFASGEPYRGLGKLGTQLNLNTDTVGSIRLAIPPVEEQRAIADFVVCKTAAIDALIAKKGRLIELLQEKRQALITQAVTKGLDSGVTMKDSGVEWLGAVPAHWNVHKLGYGVRLRGGYAFKSDLFQPEGVAVVRMNNLKRGRLDLSDAARIDSSHCQREVELAAGDLLWGMSGSIGPTGSLGNFAIVQGDDLPAQLNQRMGRFEPLLGYAEVSFIKHLVQTPVFTEQILLHVAGTAQFNVSAEQVESCLVPFPPVSEQRAIASYLDRLNADLERIGARVSVLIEKLREYRQALITAAVTGKVDLSKEAA